ncbi:hypothetical protein G7Z17_g6818 [Cylindrodendrum hubeiense]|uniref:Uncharacterized protein n=1 Tax=Cylindrodendrum hubeiense TaxID=595255 RepID=A0A9P5L7X3_9HYPO|nr:hypothetical protein G7Z17_g6818 [Cylindrodendrum hubeiense]
MHFSFIYFLSLVALAQAQWKSCARFWPKNAAVDKFTIHTQCHLFPGYPKDFGKTKVSVSYTQKWSLAGFKTNLVAPVLHNALDESITTYSEFATLPNQIVIILTTAVDGTATAETVYPVEKHSPCQVKTYNIWTKEAAGANVPRALQALAHELYHCVQGLELGNIQDPQWVLDGSANYFSNVVFPSLNVEWPRAGFKYNPALPIYAQVGRDVYGTSIFFQALEESKGTSYLNNWVLSTDSASAGDEKNRLSQLSGFADEFFLFAKQFSLQSIRDTSNVLIPGLPAITPVPTSVSFNTAGTIGTASLRTVPFTISVFKLSLKPGQTAVIYSSAKGNQRLAYRRPSEKEWSEMPSSPGSTSGGFDLPCNDKDSAETILVLFVSTADIKSDTVKVTIKRQRATDCKLSGGFVLYPLFDEKTSGARCPTGTHHSSSAWCCPDGMELDLAVASEVSICCPTCRLHIFKVPDVAANCNSGGLQ